MAEARASQREDRSVTIVGAGIAGMTAALRLLEAGFDVTVLERSSTVGGKFGAIKAGNVYHEHAYHFLSDWCLNFWELARSLSLSKNEHFVRRDAIKFLRPKPETGHVPGDYTFFELKHGGSMRNFWSNVYSGVIPPGDMIAYAYSLLDVVTGRDDDPDELEFLNRISVNAFMRSRTYMTDAAALLHQEALLKAFAVPSYETSVRSYRTFLRFFGRDAGGWILKGDCHSTFWTPFLEKLESYTGHDGGPRFELCCATELEDIQVEADPRDALIARVTSIAVRGRPEPMRPKHLILAVPYPEVVRLVQKNRLLRTWLPDLLDLRKLRSRQMASLDLYFKNALPGIPAEHVTLIDDRDWDYRLCLAFDGDIASKYALSFVDNYQAWNGRTPPQETWLNVVAADFEALAGLPDDVARDAIIGVLRDYLDFERDEIDWSRSAFRPNADAPLFANSVGSWQFRPETRTDRPEYEGRWVHSRVKNLYLAGDYCRSKIDLVCLEGAVTTGIAAARAVAGEDKVKAPLVPPEVSRQECEEAKAALAPWLALTAKGRTIA
jgi:NAD(P)-binding Rossmann-like domain/Flavin containing amine oxidoreductase